jgi:hypothetical protein
MRMTLAEMEEVGILAYSITKREESGSLKPVMVDELVKILAARKEAWIDGVSWEERVRKGAQKREIGG